MGGPQEIDGAPIEELVGKIDPREPDVIQSLRRHLRTSGRAYNTEKAYVKWVKRFMRVRGLSTEKHFGKISTVNVEAFLTDLAVDGNVAASTQEQAMFGLKYLFEYVLQRPLNEINAIRSDKPQMVPTVMSKPEVQTVLAGIEERYLLVAQLLYGCGLRIGECLRLRIRDIDFDLGQIRVFNSKGMLLHIFWEGGGQPKGTRDTKCSGDTVVWVEQLINRVGRWWMRLRVL